MAAGEVSATARHTATLLHDVLVPLGFEKIPHLGFRSPPRQRVGYDDASLEKRR